MLSNFLIIEGSSRPFSCRKKEGVLQKKEGNTGTFPTWQVTPPTARNNISVGSKFLFQHTHKKRDGPGPTGGWPKSCQPLSSAHLVSYFISLVHILKKKKEKPNFAIDPALTIFPWRKLRIQLASAIYLFININTEKQK